MVAALGVPAAAVLDVMAAAAALGMTAAAAAAAAAARSGDAGRELGRDNDLAVGLRVNGWS